MKLIFNFLVFAMLGNLAFSQSNTLIYKRLIRGQTESIERFDNGNGYALTLLLPDYWMTDDTVSNIGVWEDDMHHWNINDTVYSLTSIIYDSSLYQTGKFNTIYQEAKPDKIIPFSNQQLILEIGPNVNYELPAHTVPPVSGFDSSQLSERNFIHFNPTDNTADGILYYSVTSLIDSTIVVPYYGFSRAAYGGSTDLFVGIRSTGVVVNDSLLISHFTLRGEQGLNNELGFSASGNQINILRATFTLDSGEISAQTIGSSTGSLVTYSSFPSRTGTSVYRVGLVRGPSPVSVSGAELYMEPGDSLYHVFITNESIDGTTDWLTQLYAYNNTFADTSVNFEDLRVKNHFYSLHEKSNSIFISSLCRVKSAIGDTLIYRDFLGNDHLYANEVPNYWGDSTIAQIPLSKVSLYKIDTTGNVEKELSYTQKVLEAVNFNLLKNNASKLFDVADKLAWVYNYNNVTDTTTVFTCLSTDGSEVNTVIDIPAGKGVGIVWLDTDLTIIDHWFIPYSNSELLLGYVGMDIMGVYSYGGDTLLIEGNIGSATYTTLDPTGNAQQINPGALGESSYFAFYSAPEILTNTSVRESLTDLRVYPNPARNVLNLSGLAGQKGRYRIFDLSGRLVQVGLLSEEHDVAISSLSDGLYILRVDTKTGSGSRKFVVQ